MGSDFKATIHPKSPRALAWLEVFRELQIPLQSPIPERASAPGVPEGLFYQLDLKELTEAQRERLIIFIAKKFALPRHEVADTLDEVGCPILADDVTVTVFNPLKWI